MLKAILFDMDGTLMENHHLHIKAWQIFYTKYHPDETITADDPRLIGPGTEAIIDALWSIKLSKPALTLLHDEKEFIYRELAEENLTLIQGAKQFIDFLRQQGYKTALVTNANSVNLQFSISVLGLEKSFDSIVSIEDVAQGKPSPEPYLLAAQKLGFSPTECCVFEDSEVGIRSATNAGCAVIMRSASVVPSLSKNILFSIKDFLEYQNWFPSILQNMP